MNDSVIVSVPAVINQGYLPAQLCCTQSRLAYKKNSAMFYIWRKKNPDSFYCYKTVYGNPQLFILTNFSCSVFFIQGFKLIKILCLSGIFTYLLIYPSLFRNICCQCYSATFVIRKTWTMSCLKNAKNLNHYLHFATKRLKQEEIVSDIFRETFYNWNFNCPQVWFVFRN